MAEKSTGTSDSTGNGDSDTNHGPSPPAGRPNSRSTSHTSDASSTAQPKHSTATKSRTTGTVGGTLPTTPTAPSSTSTSATISYGPPISTSVQEGTTSPSSRPNNDVSPGFSDGAKKAVIAATTIGGTLILIFLIYALWRRRKGASYSEIVHFRRHSSTIILGGAPSERLTALPIYRESRYSVRSSKYGSAASVSKSAKRTHEVPPAVARRFHSQNPWVQDAWKSGNPPSPLGQMHPLNQASFAADDVKSPEMAHVSTSQSRAAKPLPELSGSTSKPGPSITVRRASFAKEDDEFDEAESQYNPERWSWTNSQAPPTPRYATSLQSSLSSLPRFRKVKSWVRNQTVRTAARMDEERGFIDGIPEVPTLKNKAWKPNLAPKPTRKLSKRSLHTDDDTFIIQSNTDQPVTRKPVPARSKNAR